MDYGLTGKRALVLGASRGLGAASAHLLAEEGAHVIRASRNVQDGESAEAVTLDLADPASVSALCDYIAQEPVDILVNNCGGPAAGPARGRSTEQWSSAFNTMSASLFRITDAAIPGMAERGWGRVVTIGSSGILQPIAGLALSNGVRGAVAGWSKTLAEEVAPLGITVNMVLPGRIATDRVEELDASKAAETGKTIAETVAASKATIPMGRYGEPAEFAAAIAFLCSTQASYITGSMLRVDGGLIRGLG